MSTSHSQRHCRSTLRGVLFVIGRYDLLIPPLAQGQLFTARELHLCPWRIFPTTSRQKKMSLLPWWGQVMDFMFTSGVQVKTWGSHWRWPSQLRHPYQSCVQTYRLWWESIKRVQHWFPCQTCLFVVGYCCARGKSEQPWALNSSISYSLVNYNACVIAVRPIKTLSTGHFH